MNAITFPEQNTIFAEHQNEYLPLPAFREHDGCVTTCWRLSMWERVRVLFTGRVWLSQMTFNDSLQPVAMRVEHPFEKAGPP